LVCITKITELNSPIADEFLRTRIQIKWLITFEATTAAIYNNILFGSITTEIPSTLVRMPLQGTVSKDFLRGSDILNMSKIIETEGLD